MDPHPTKRYKLFFTAIAPHLLSTCDFKAHVIESDVIGILTMEDINFFVKNVDRKGNGIINIKDDMDFAFFHY